MDEITSDMRNINSIFVEKNYTLYIPVFQREFVWDQEVAEQLMNDFNEDSNSFSIDSSELPGYLLGNIVLIKPTEDTPYYSVVDGQQRLISLTLLAKALFDRLILKIAETNSDESEMRTWVRIQGDLDKVYSVLNDENEWIGHRIRFNDYLKYGNFYSELISLEGSEDTQTESLVKAENNILEVYSKFRDKILELDDIQLKKFANYFKKNIKLIVTVAPTEEKAFQLFEVLNSRGRVLEPLDLIKNIFLQKIYEDDQNEDQRSIFNRNWFEFSENLEITRHKVIPSSTFLKHYIMARYGENKRKDKLYTYIKSMELNSSEIIDLSKDLNRTSAIYRDVEKKEYQSFIDSTNDSIDQAQGDLLKIKIRIIFEILGITQFHSLLIPFYFESFENKIKVLDSAIKYGAAVLFAQRQTNVIENGIERFLSEYINSEDDENKFENLINMINDKKNSYIQDFRNNLYMVNYGNRKQKALTLLKFIEIYGNNNISVLNAPKTGINSITLEHMMPQTPSNTISENNFEDSNLYNLYVNYIGNLTLLKKSDNSGVQNISFGNKRGTYGSSLYNMTSNIIAPLQNNRSSGQDYDQVTYINSWNIQYTELSDAEGNPLDISEHWTKQAIISRGKKITDFVIELLH
uniref:DUF262 domain-containing protein n=1 Tax=Carnobacterium sp. TaxID=48221 RepID=UPI001597339B|nr:DUF262 domain-containing protein [Carnobacterium sp.]QJS06095.1 hypothetical protein [Carnobacterium sp.]